MQLRKIVFISSAFLAFNTVHANVHPTSVTINKGFQKSSQGLTQRYWASPGKNSILKSDLDGKNVSIVVNELERPYGLVHDESNNLLLWTSSGDELVRALTPTGLQYDLVTSFEFPYTIVVSKKEVNIAYTVKKNQLVKITQNKYSESKNEEVLATIDEATRGLSHDVNRGQLYLGDRYGRMSMRFDLNKKALSKLQYEQLKFPIESSTKPLVSELFEFSKNTGGLK